MDASALIRASGKKSRDEFVRWLNRSSEEKVKKLRSQLFDVALRDTLADSGDALVGRRKMAGDKKLKQKYIDDVWKLACAIRKGKPVPRILLKNRKRPKAKWMVRKLFLPVFS